MSLSCSSPYLPTYRNERSPDCKSEQRRLATSLPSKHTTPSKIKRALLQLYTATPLSYLTALDLPSLCFYYNTPHALPSHAMTWSPQKPILVGQSPARLLTDQFLQHPLPVEHIKGPQNPLCPVVHACEPPACQSLFPLQPNRKVEGETAPVAYCRGHTVLTQQYLDGSVDIPRS